MRIGVARIAGLEGEAIPARLRGSGAAFGRIGRGRVQRLVAIGAGNGGVPPGEREPGLRVPLHSKRSGPESLHGMAEVAAVGRGLGRKLAAVAVGVAGGADQFAGLV